MASRVNTKFLLILAVSVVFVAVIGAGLFYMQYRGDATRHITRGDELMRAGDYETAMQSYGRAVSKERNNPVYLQKFTDALLKVVPENREQANDLYGKRLAALQQSIRYRSADAEAHLALLEELRRSARLMSDNEDSWASLAEAADQMWQQVPDADPKRIEAKLYRGIANSRRSFTVTRPELEQTRQDLVDYLAARPNSDEGHAAMIRCYLAMSEKARGDAADARAEELLLEAQNAVDAALEAVPDGADVARSTVIYMAIRREHHPGSIEDETFIAATDDMIERVRESDDALLKLDAAEIVAGISGRRDDAIALLEAHVAEHPDAVFHQLNLARQQYLADELVAAGANARELADGERELAVSFESQFLDELRRRALSMLVDIAMQRWYDADEADKPASREALAAAVSDLESRTMDRENDPLLIEAEGKLAFARGDYQTAAARFDRLARDSQTASPEVLMYAARSLEEIGELGRAYELLKQLLARRPDNRQYLFAAGTVALSLKRYEEAEHWLRQLPEDHDAGRRLLAVVTKELVSSGARGSDDSDPLARALADAGAAMDRGEIESARSMLLPFLDEDDDGTEDNPHVLFALLRAEVMADRPEQAQVYIDRLLQIYPDNRGLRQVRAELDSADRIEAIEKYVASLPLDETDRVVTALTHLQALVNAERGRAEYLEEIDRTEDAAAAVALADRAEQAARKYLAQAEQMAADHPQLQEYLFREAVEAGNWVRAEEMVQQARRSNADLAGGDLFAGQLALRRERYDDAVRMLLEATRKIPYSSAAWRELAIAHQRKGNFGEAKKAFEQAYTNNPNDVDTVQRYVDLLVRTGDETAALRVMRTAHRLIPDNIQLREQWLQLETVAGDRQLAMNRRREIYAKDLRADGGGDVTIEDTSNAKQLAMFLATTRPYRELIVDADARPVYSISAWERLRPEEQARIVTQTKRRWFTEAEEILEKLEQQGGPKLSNAALKALVLREQAPWYGDQAREKVEEGLDVLDQFIAQTPEDEVTAEMLIALAFYQTEIGRPEDALESLRRARQYQDAVEREADVAMGNLLFRRGRYTEAIQAYERAVQVNPASPMQLRLVECYATIGQFDTAKQMLESRMDSGDAGYPELMLSAAIARGNAESLYRQAIQMKLRGNAAPGEADRLVREAQAEFDQHEQELDRAARLSPSNPNPYVQRAIADLNWFNLQSVDPDEQTPDPASSTLLRDALASLDKADEVRAGETSTRMTRVAIQQTMGRVDDAIAELTRILEDDPFDVPARRRLVQLYNEQNLVPLAEQTLDEGIRRNPGLTVWYELKGDLFLNQILAMQADTNVADAQLARIPRLASKAATAYRTAVQIEANPPLVGKLVGALLNARPPAYAEAVEVIQEHDHLLEVPEGDPAAADAALLRSLYARSLNGTGERDAAVAELGQAYTLLQAEQSAGRSNEAALNQWYRGVSIVFAGRPISEIEQFITNQAPPSAKDYDWLAGLYAGDGTSEGIRRALELQRRAVEVYAGANDQARSGLLYNLAIYLVLDGQYQAAVEPFRQAIELDPTNVLALNNYAFLLADELRRYEEALGHAEKAARMITDAYPDGARSDVLDTLGWVQFLNGQRSKAESTLRQSRALRETASNSFHLAAVLAEMDKLDAARTYLETAATLNPDPRTKAEIDVLLDDIRTRRK